MTLFAASGNCLYERKRGKRNELRSGQWWQGHINKTENLGKSLDLFSAFLHFLKNQEEEMAPLFLA